MAKIAIRRDLLKSFSDVPFDAKNRSFRSGQQIDYGLKASRALGLSGSRALGLSGSRALGLSGSRALGLSGSRALGLSHKIPR
ncbi:hypothetical protein [Acidithrix ferrooxidans]|uniref:hypothetical protein n=1 Tax=Acidithrix ferrooxidans TaxID=1280514 RepID=UPI000697AD98|nr:hypothetical protein [Acidithrix ferrooxidans]